MSDIYLPISAPDSFSKGSLQQPVLSLKEYSEEINWSFLYRGNKAALKELELTARWNLNQIYFSSQKGKSSKQFLGFVFQAA